MGRGPSREHESAGQSQVRPPAALVSAEATGGRQRSLLVGLSEWVRLGGIGFLDHLLGASPSWQLCLAKAQGLAERPPHHLPAPASSWCFYPPRLLKLRSFEIRPPQRGPLCSSQALGAGRGGVPRTQCRPNPGDKSSPFLEHPEWSSSQREKAFPISPPLAQKLCLQPLKELPKEGFPLTALGIYLQSSPGAAGR